MAKTNTAWALAAAHRGLISAKDAIAIPKDDVDADDDDALMYTAILTALKSF